MSPELAMLQGCNNIDTVGENTADTTGVTVTAAASANTKGASWQEIISSTTIRANYILVMLGGTGTSSGDYLVDIAIGAAGSEKSLIDNIQFSQVAIGGQVSAYLFPVVVPAGSRLSSKCQATNASGTIEVIIVLIGAGDKASQGLSRVSTYGATTADSGGTGVDPGGTINTKGGWQQIVASTTYPIKQLLVVIGDRANTAMSTCNWLMDIGVGAGSAEKVLIPALFFCAGTTPDGIIPNIFGPFPVNIPAGTRISANPQCNINDASDRLIDVTLYGVD